MRFEDGVNVTRADIDALLSWDPAAAPSHEIAFHAARSHLQDFTGPLCRRSAAMRDAIVKLGGDADRVNPLAPAELVIDHSGRLMNMVRPDHSRQQQDRVCPQRRALLIPALGQTAFRNFKVVPPTLESSTRSTSNYWAGYFRW